MGSKTGVIRFNVKDRGRRFRGQNRNFDTEQLAKIINGGDVQERVKHRDLLGFFGHWPRVKFGLNPTEGAIIDGKHISIEPAIVTTYLKALPDGSVEHESEFLDTTSGKLAERMFNSKTGGFSSAIDVRPAGDKQFPLGFYGFDYVMEPNYTRNRGHELMLDGVSDATLMLMDDVGEYMAMLDGVNRLYDQAQQAYQLQAETLTRLEQENAQLIAMLAATGAKQAPVLDGVMNISMRPGSVQRFNAGMAFMEMEHLTEFESPKEAGDGADDGLNFLSKMLSRR